MVISCGDEMIRKALEVVIKAVMALTDSTKAVARLAPCAYPEYQDLHYTEGCLWGAASVQCCTIEHQHRDSPHADAAVAGPCFSC